LGEEPKNKINKGTGMNTVNNSVSVIKSRTGWQVINFRELKEYRDLFFFLAWRDIKALYAQTIMGLSWAILQPLIQIVLFTVIFGKVAQISTDGIPYFLFSTVAIIPWTYMSQAMTMSSESLVTGQQILGKVYFPRLIFPVTPIISKMVDFGCSLLIVIAVMIYYGVMPTWNLLFLPFFIILMMLIPASTGLWLSSLAIRYRDVRQVMPFTVRMLMYTGPIVYAFSSIPEQYRFLYSLNPIVGVIEGFRACLLGSPIPWTYIYPGIITSVILLVSGAFYFKKMERIVADVI
jgi:lipopolysaccharide transport system permease protein